MLSLHPRRLRPSRFGNSRGTRHTLAAMATGKNASGEATRELLIRTAERLFAQRGIGAVSLREIGKAAGQRNNAAIHYHFGDIDGLVAAIFAFRSPSVAERRLAILADIDLHGRADDVRSLATAIVLPLAEQVTDDNHYIGFLARLELDQSRQAFIRNMDAAISSGYSLVWERVRSCLPELTNRIFFNRAGLVVDLTVQALANRQLMARLGAVPPMTEQAFCEDLVDAVTGVLTAPSHAHAPVGPAGRT
jgi:AcrR family transcriptional regulator